MSSDEQFTAMGAAIIGFQTHAVDGPIDRGVDVSGTEVGVRGFCDMGPGVEGLSESDVGVNAKGATGLTAEGVSGPGVEGRGGIHEGTKVTAEAGVVGRGASHADKTNVKRMPHGAGVIGIGGGKGSLNDSENLFGSSGVFGIGADALEQKIDGKIVGPRFAGTGVVGVGGVLEHHDDAPNDHAPGVVGMSAGFGLNTVQQEKWPEAGVYGSGTTGIVGRGTNGPGVEGQGAPGGVVGAPNDPTPGVVGRGGIRTFDVPQPVAAAGVVGLAGGIGGYSDSRGAGVYGSGDIGVKGVSRSGRGGVFQSSSKAAQVGLSPVIGPPLPTQVAHIPQVVDKPPNQGLKLPSNGRRGDLMAVSEGRSRCRLWFCVRGDGSRGAKWAQVLLGPEFDGAG